MNLSILVTSQTRQKDLFRFFESDGNPPHDSVADWRLDRHLPGKLQSPSWKQGGTSGSWDSTGVRETLPGSPTTAMEQVERRACGTLAKFSLPALSVPLCISVSKKYRETSSKKGNRGPSICSSRGGAFPLIPATKARAENDFCGCGTGRRNRVGMQGKCVPH